VLVLPLVVANPMLTAPSVALFAIERFAVTVVEFTT
jgi:hypothetical protein